MFLPDEPRLSQALDTSDAPAHSLPIALLEGAAAGSADGALSPKMACALDPNTTLLQHANRYKITLTR